MNHGVEYTNQRIRTADSRARTLREGHLCSRRPLGPWRCRYAVRPRPPGAGQLPHLSIPRPDRLPLPRLWYTASLAPASPRQPLERTRVQPAHDSFAALPCVCLRCGRTKSLPGPGSRAHLCSPQAYMGLVLRHNCLLGPAQRFHRTPRHPRSLGPSTT